VQTYVPAATFDGYRERVAKLVEARFR
jgi:hypothetical protein